MYFVDRSKIEQTLTYMDSLLQELWNQSFESFQEKLLLERITQMIIESMLDVGNMMIDGFIMRDPGSYEDIIDILVDEKVLPSNDQDGYKKVVRLRTLLVKEYLNIDHEKVKSITTENKQLLNQFGDRVRTYLENELGVANAFSNE
ncbi:type VII toxin-antitoxin system HepT family RNase toxin [Virgibacillus sp. DJP39]|uniref:type VII toxin-antitoxin system HepT family RNase toxin n=1 Tax=Virgibacillus sp. DJP39 TaxID=3409790 RepID=UPI003BB4A651